MKKRFPPKNGRRDRPATPSATRQQIPRGAKRGRFEKRAEQSEREENSPREKRRRPFDDRGLSLEGRDRSRPPHASQPTASTRSAARVDRHPKPGEQRPRQDRFSESRRTFRANADDDVRRIDGGRAFRRRANEEIDRGDQRPERRRQAKPVSPERSRRHDPKPTARSAGADKSRPDYAPHQGPFWIYGRHAVAAALANPDRTVRRLCATDAGRATLEGRVQHPRMNAASTMTTEEIDRLLPDGAVHQGLAVEVDDLPRARLRDVCAPDERRRPVVVLDQITDPQNIGAILRSAAAFGAAAVIVQERRTPPLAGALAKAAAGAVEIIPCVKVVNIARALDGLKGLGYFVVGLAGDAALPIRALPLDQPIALVLGAEGEGLRPLVAKTCDALHRIDIEPAMESLNVSTAAAVSLYAVTRGALNIRAETGGGTH